MMIVAVMALMVMTTRCGDDKDAAHNHCGLGQSDPHVGSYRGLHK